MEIKVRDIVSVIEEFAPSGIQEKWDNCGLSIGSMDMPVSSVLLGLDCTPELVDEAVACGADMIVTHHPLIFSGLRRITPDDQVGMAVMKAVKAGVAVYSAHTSADKVLHGVSGAMARRLGLENIEILDMEDDGVGLGAVGDLPQPMAVSDAISFVKERFSLDVVRTSRPFEGSVTRIAMCGGSGSSLIEKARTSGAQMYISGDISYHHFFTAPGFIIMDVGHYESEIEILAILFSLLKKNFPNFAVRITENKHSNPIFYY